MMLKGDTLYFYGSKAGTVDGNNATVDKRFQCGEVMGWLASKGYVTKWV
jgi:hypothetical protein